MHHRGNRVRIFALVWAVLQFALPAVATVADARLAVASTGQGHVEDGPGANCAPAHSPDCLVCKHLSTSLLGAAHVPAGSVTDGGAGVAPGRIVRALRAPDGVALPRAPPAAV